MDVHIFDYYLSLLQVQMAILGIVVAGLVTLMQMLNNAVPKRKVKMLASSAELICFVIFLSLLLFTLAVAAWATAFADATSLLVAIFSDRLIAFSLLLLCLVGLLWFVYLIYRTKRLLDPRIYLGHYIDNIKPELILTYVATVYSAKATNYSSKYASQNGFKETHEFRELLEHIDKLYDPFQPVREYIKHNAQQQFDYGTATGIKLFGKLFDKAFVALTPSDTKTSTYLAEHVASSSVELFHVFHKTSSEKRKLDIIRLLYVKGHMFLKAHNDDALLIVVRALEEMGEMSHDETETVTIIECVQDLTNTYFALHEKASWNEIGGAFEEVCTSMIRLAESYYLQAEYPVRSVPLVSYYTGKHRDVSVSFVNFFMGYRNLADLRIEAYPKQYFEAVEALCEALYTRISDINESGRAAIGMNGNYHVLTARLYKIYTSFALEAIQHKRPDLFALSMGNLRRILKSANSFKLEGEREVIAKIILDLTAKSTAVMPDLQVKGRSILEYVVDVLGKYTTTKDIEAVFAEIPETKQDATIRYIKEQLLNHPDK